MEQRRLSAKLRQGARKIKSFLFSKKNRELLVFLFFVIVSSLFWLLQTLNEDYEAEIVLPVQYKNVPENVVITSEAPEEIKALVKDKGFILLNYKVQGGLRPIIVDFNEYKDKGIKFKIATPEIQRQIVEQLQSSTRLTSFKPDAIELVYTRGKAKKVPVRIAGNFSAKQQYDITNVFIYPDSVMIYAPQEVLDTISNVHIASASYHELDDTIQFRTELAHMNNVKIAPKNVIVKVCVDQLTEKTLDVSITAINVPAGKMLRTFPAKVKLTFQTVLGYYKHITPGNFVIQVDYNEIIKNGKEKCEPTVLHAPNTIKHLRIWPKEIDYLIEENSNANP